jgi:hypothetical protein
MSKMEIKHVLYSSRNMRTFFIIFIGTAGFLGFNTCVAQSVIGKWQRSFTRIYTVDKATGKQVSVSADVQKQYDEALAKRGYKETLELKPDNTYISTVTTIGATPAVHSGKYSLSGKDLDMNIPLVNGQKTSITIHSLTSGTMIWDLIFMGKLTGIIYTKI